MRPAAVETAALFCDLGSYRGGNVNMERQEKDGEHQENTEPAPRGGRLSPKRASAHNWL